jgi:hypothetical protein
MDTGVTNTRKLRAFLQWCASTNLTRTFELPGGRSQQAAPLTRLIDKAQRMYDSKHFTMAEIAASCAVTHDGLPQHPHRPLSRVALIGIWSPLSTTPQTAAESAPDSSAGHRQWGHSTGKAPRDEPWGPSYKPGYIVSRYAYG